MRNLRRERLRPGAAAVLCVGASLLFAGCGSDDSTGTVQENKVAPGNSGGGALDPSEQSGGAGAARGE